MLSGVIAERKEDEKQNESELYAGEYQREHRLPEPEILRRARQETRHIHVAGALDL